MSSPETLVLVPTALESKILFDREPEDGETLAEFPRAVFGIAGFGLAAAGVKAAHHLATVQPTRCLLLGIGGTYDEARAPIGEVALATSVAVDGIGAGEGSLFETADAMGFRQLPQVDPGPIALKSSDLVDSQGLMVSAAAASASSDEAQRRRLRHPAALVEDMEAWSIALACRHAKIPLTVIRAISNRAGVRDPREWQTVPALRALRKLLPALLS